MRPKKEQVILFLSLIVIGAFLGAMVYKSLYVDLYGSFVRKATIRNVVVYSNQHAYYVTNNAIVEAIYTEASQLKRMNRTPSSQNYNYQVYVRLPHFLIQTQSNASFGGNIWNNGQLMNANGFYWKMTPRLLHLLKKSTEDSQTIKVY